MFNGTLEGKMCEETQNVGVTIYEIREAVFSTTDRDHFLLLDVVDKLKTAYPEKEVSVALLRAYLSQLETYGLVEESRSGVGLDKKYQWNNPFNVNKV